ncbi:aspartate aminotransferase family protein [Schnuerera sp. xch1]|uniref:aspartate aminotransferase family protein n=1 Tax=Schnuerera sp. xch1 TaxID=2874283 RepID=UPI001CBEF9CF|nr:aspartate aminotransferase family protein [Schnuerera sp. xch1]MBZ2174637.1 aspartate aminotransferase family protein [Schnuerera sp. xch1]
MTVKIDNCIDIVKEDDKVICPSARVPYYPLVVKRGRGAIIEDVDGNNYIDLLSSAAALNTGHTHPKVVDAIIKQAKEFIHYTPAYMYHESLVKLAKELIDITPGHFNKKVAFGLSGSDANDGVIKLARAYTGRSKIITYIQSYHGSTYGAISMSALSLNMRRKIGPLVPDIHHIPYPDCYRCLFDKNEEICDLECLKLLENDFKHYIPIEEVAAIVIEPIAGDAGLVIPPKKYIDKLYSLCKEYQILFVSEEVQQGFGRTGKWFGINHFDIEPDIVVMAKSIASGMPMSAIVAKEEIMQSMGAPAHLFTMGGNPIACRAALATIEVIKEENLINHSKELGEYVKERFNEMKDKYSLIGDVRGLGLSIGVDLVKDRDTKEKAQNAAAKICYRCWEKGVLLTFFSNSVLRIQPPLVINKEQIDKALNIIEESINEYINGHIPDEVLEIAKGW